MMNQNNEIMEHKEEIVNVFMGSQYEVNILKQIFEDNNIKLLLKEEYGDGGAAGYVAHSSDLLGVYVFLKDKERAIKLVEEFKKS